MRGAVGDIEPEDGIAIAFAGVTADEVFVPATVEIT